MAEMPLTLQRSTLPPLVISITSSSLHHLGDAHHLAVAGRGADRDDALAAAVLDAVVVEGRALAEADSAVTVRIVAPGDRISMPTTSSPTDPSVMPRTPAAVRPMGRTCLSGKRIDLPRLVARITSWMPVVRRALITSSSLVEIDGDDAARGADSRRR